MTALGTAEADGPRAIRPRYTIDWTDEFLVCSKTYVLPRYWRPFSPWRFSVRPKRLSPLPERGNSIANKLTVKNANRNA